MEFNLSEKELELQNVHAEWSDVYYKKDIKEFIKRLNVLTASTNGNVKVN